MRRACLVGLVLWAALVITACDDDEEGAHIDVIVSDVEPGLGGELDRVEISMVPVPPAGTDAVIVSRPVVARGARVEPVSARFEPVSASHVGRQLYRFRVVGFRGETAYVEAQNRLVFVGGTRLILPIRLSPACVGVRCADHETCDPAGICRDAFVPACSLIEEASAAECAEPDAAPVDSSAPPPLPPPLDLGADVPRIDLGPDDDDAGPAPDMGPPPACGASTDDCDDGIECTIDSCVGGTCVSFADDARCDDGIECTLDACSATEGCTASPRDTLCDDGNPCTDDRCAETGCAPTANEADCDDDDFCNGADRCGAGTCSVHVGNPCVGGTVCDATGATCVGCTRDSECPAMEMSPWRACGDFTGECDENGLQSRSVATFSCVAGSCQRLERTEDRACDRPTTGMPCTDDGNDCTADACQTGDCVHPARVGAPCVLGQCNGAGMCVGCLTDDQCSDGDLCTLDICSGAGDCVYAPASMVQSFRTSFGLEGFCSDTGGGGYQRVEAGCFHGVEPMELHRGYVTFDTRAIPASTAITSATLRMCATGGPGAALMELYPVVGVPIPLECPGIFSIGPAGPLAAVIPDVLGPIALTVPASTVRPGDVTQFGLHYPETTCESGSWAAKRYATSDGPAPTDRCPADSPWWLDVTYCTAPY